MKMTFENSSRTCPPGLTLVEVLAALVIMGTILTGLVMAKSHHTRQLAIAREQQAATHVLDSLLSQWWSSPQGVPINQRGSIEKDGRWTWESRTVPNSAIQETGARVVRVELRPAAGEAERAPENSQLTVAVELVLPEATGGKTGVQR